MNITILRNESPLSNEELTTLASDYEIPTGEWSFNASPFGYPTRGVAKDNLELECRIRVEEVEPEFPGYDAVHDYYSW